MAPFTIAEVIAQLLTGWGLNVAKVLAEAQRIRDQYPDLAPRIDAFEAWLRVKLDPVLDVEKFKNMIRGIATDIMTGLSGVDHDAWHGSV